MPLRAVPQAAARAFGLMRSPNRDGPLVAVATLLGSMDKRSFDRGHQDTVFTAAFTDGKTLASGSGGLERAVKFWEVADATLLAT